MKIKDVHTEHCCQIHGCKYMPTWNLITKQWEKQDCTVTKLIAPQSHPCEWCFDDEELEQAYKQNEIFNKGIAWAMREGHDLAVIIFHDEVK